MKAGRVIQSEIKAKTATESLKERPSIKDIHGSSKLVFPGYKLKGNEKFAKLYHYTSFDTFVKIWLTKQLKLGEIYNVNDILEIDKNASFSFQQAALLYAWDKIIDSYKQISFTMDYDSYVKGCMSPLMWGVYAQKRKGICIEFDYNKMPFTKNMLKDIVTYKSALKKHVELPSDAKSIIDIKNFIIKNSKDIFFTKHISWKAENEFRFVSTELSYLDISGAITAIYLTSNDSMECLLTEKLVNGSIPVKYLEYLDTKNQALPILSDTYSNRENIKNAKNNPQNTLISIKEQARQKYESLKHDENASLLFEPTFNSQ